MKWWRTKIEAKREKGWYKWFAWYPVKVIKVEKVIDPYHKEISKKYIWLEYVWERRWVSKVTFGVFYDHCEITSFLPTPTNYEEEVQ